MKHPLRRQKAPSEEFGKNPMIERRPWMEFRESGMLWWVNRILHAFGWAIVMEWDVPEGKDVATYPLKKEPRAVYCVRTKYRGFAADAEDAGFKLVAKYLAKHATKLQKEAR